jgi:PAS domain S-box-containing protein
MFNTPDVESADERLSTDAVIQAMLGLMPESGLVLDQSLRIVAANSAFSVMFGQTAEQVSGLSLSAITSLARPDLQARLALFSQRNTPHSTWSFSTHLPKSGAQVLQVEAHMLNLTHVLLKFHATATEGLRKTQQATWLGQVRDTLLNAPDVAHVTRAVLDALRDAFGYTHVGVYFLNDQVLYLQGHIGYERALSEIPVWRGVCGRVVRSQEATLVKDVVADKDYVGAVPGITSEVCVPFWSSQGVSGVLNVEALAPAYLTEADLHAMQSIAEYISFAYERADIFARLERGEKRYETALRTGQIGLWEYDIQTGKNYWSNTYKDMLGYHTEAEIEWLIHNWHEMTAPEDQARIAELSRKCIAGEVTEFSMERKLRRRNGEYFWSQSRGAVVFDATGRPALIIGTEVDITERKQAEAQLFALAVEHEKTVILEQFVKDISHDLGTPLTVLGTSGYLLEKLVERLLKSTAQVNSALAADDLTNVGKPMVEMSHTVGEISKTVSSVQRSSDRLQYLVRSMLDMMRLDSQTHFQFAPHDIVSVVKQAAEAHQAAMSEKQIQFDFDVQGQLPTIQLDAYEFSRVVENLLDNAVNHTPQGGGISLSLAQTPGFIALTVSDTGIGISPADLPYIFERFFRGDKARTARQGGTGLGLAIVKKIVEAHHGSIQVMSALGQGTSFRVLLPLSR